MLVSAGPKFEPASEWARTKGGQGVRAIIRREIGPDGCGVAGLKATAAWLSWSSIDALSICAPSAAAALRMRVLWKLLWVALPADTVHRHPGSVPQVGHSTAALRLLVRPGWRQLSVAVLAVPSLRRVWCMLANLECYVVSLVVDGAGCWLSCGMCEFGTQ